jgi:hypothetical protein
MAVPVSLTVEQITSAIKNIYIRQLAEIGGISGGGGAGGGGAGGVPNTMKMPWDAAQFIRLATASAVPASAIAAPLPGAIPPLAPTPWTDYARIDYTNVTGVVGGNVARDKVRIASLQCDLRAPDDILQLLTVFFNGSPIIYKSSSIRNIPTSSELLSYFIIPLIKKNILKLDIIINLAPGIPISDSIIAAALVPHILQIDIIQRIDSNIRDLYIESLGIRKEEKDSFARYDTRVNQLRDALR